MCWSARLMESGALAAVWVAGAACSYMLGRWSAGAARDCSAGGCARQSQCQCTALSVEHTLLLLPWAWTCQSTAGAQRASQLCWKRGFAPSSLWFPSIGTVPFRSSGHAPSEEERGPAGRVVRICAFQVQLPAYQRTTRLPDWSSCVDAIALDEARRRRHNTADRDRHHAPWTRVTLAAGATCWPQRCFQRP